MKLSLTLVLSLFAAVTFGNPTFKKLNELNKCWAEQRDLNSIPFEKLTANTETAWIQLHLQLVEQTLRSRSTSALTPVQRTNRLQALEHLNEYWHAAKFPQNEEFSYRLPIFIDKYDNFCAVGYLVKATGYEAVSRKISAKTNYAYVRDMKYPELFAWAKEYGFTVDELAWIQPTYWSNCDLHPVGKGAAGSVRELYVDTATQRMYVGGVFQTVDSSITANNIAYVTEANGVYTWHNVGTGINGSVNAIVKYGNDIFAAGSFTGAGGNIVANVAKWDGTSWAAAGCINGNVNDLVVFNGELYAAGQFGVCSPSTQVSFAKWTGTAWQGITGLSGRVNTLEVRDSLLYIGGAFTYNGNPANVVKWNTNGGFQPFTNNVVNEVMDFELFADTMYLVCKHTSPVDSTLFNKLQGNTWSFPYAVQYYGTKSFNALCSFGDTITIGGQFENYPMLGTYVFNSISAPVINSFGYNNWFYTDSTINKMVVFKNVMIAGGDFFQGIGKRVSYFVPNNPPKATAKAFKSCDSTSTGTASVNVTQGWGPFKYKWSTGDTTAVVQNLPPGTYSVIVTDAYGAKDTALATVAATMIDTTVTVTGNHLTANVLLAKYQWINCADNSDIPGAVYIFYNAPATGSYAVRITIDSCAKVFGCHNVEVTSVEELQKNSVSIYPNPVNNELTVSLKQTAQKVSITLTDIAGRTMVKQQYANTSTIKVNTSTLAKGVYFLMLEENGKMSQYKLVKD